LVNGTLTARQRTEWIVGSVRRVKGSGRHLPVHVLLNDRLRARRVGGGIVREERRRGVEAIVLAAEEPSRVRGGTLFGGGSPLENYVGEVTKYVIRKAPCRVFLTAPPTDREERRDADAPAPSPAPSPSGTPQ